MKSFFTFLLIVLALGVQAQSTSNVDTRLIDALGTETVEYLQKNNPFLIQYQTIQLDHVWEIQTFPEGKLADMPEVNLRKSDLKNPNVLLWIKKFNLKRAQDYHTYYRIGRSDQVLVLFSEDHFAQQFNKLTGRVK